MSPKYSLDANVFITAWFETYPPRIFSPLWKKLATYTDDIELIRPVFAEIDTIQSQHRRLSIEKKRELYPLRFWMDGCGFNVIDIDGAIENLSISMEKEYEISEMTKGAGQNDITLIAYAKIYGMTVVTLEAQQKQKPGKKSNCKIPIICSEQGIRCINFIEFLDELKVEI